MAELKLLIPGYAKLAKNGYRASSATVLVRDSGKIILVDPGCNEARLLASLKKEKIKPSDIDYIFLTHFHLDHILNIRLFPETTILDVDTIYKGDRGVLYTKFVHGTKIQVVPTPGHAHEHGALLVQTEKGKVAIAGDIFWWQDDEEQKLDYKSLVNKADPFVKNKKQLIASRRLLFKMADWIIPGHGEMFKMK
ncbi:MAG: MBL fold metallo-hydrolase [Patescibacteria group bacterium]